MVLVPSLCFFALPCWICFSALHGCSAPPVPSARRDGQVVWVGPGCHGATSPCLGCHCCGAPACFLPLPPAARASGSTRTYSVERKEVGSFIILIDSLPFVPNELGGAFTETGLQRGYLRAVLSFLIPISWDTVRQWAAGSRAPRLAYRQGRLAHWTSAAQLGARALALADCLLGHSSLGGLWGRFMYRCCREIGRTRETKEG